LPLWSSIHSRIQQTHIDLANELLIGTTLPLDAIARACGFNSRERFSAVYRQITGRTPRAQTFRFEIFFKVREKNFARYHISTYAHLHPQFLPGARTNVSFGPYIEARRFLLRPPEGQPRSRRWRWTG